MKTCVCLPLDAIVNELKDVLFRITLESSNSGRIIRILIYTKII